MSDKNPVEEFNFYAFWRNDLFPNVHGSAAKEEDGKIELKGYGGMRLNPKSVIAFFPRNTGEQLHSEIENIAEEYKIACTALKKEALDKLRKLHPSLSHNWLEKKDEQA